LGIQLIVNRLYKIDKDIIEPTKEIIGKLVAYNAIKNEATLQLSENIFVTTESQNLKLI
jgi:hypothetical protein